MIRLKCNCSGDGNGVDLILRGRSFECLPEPIPEEEFMIAPLDVEALGPTSTVAVGVMEYLTHSKVFMDLKGGVGINCPFPGTGTMTLEVYADGQKIFNNPLVFTGQTMTVPRSGLRDAWKTIQSGIRLDVQVTALSNPATYPGFRGLRVVFLPQAIEIP